MKKFKALSSMITLISAFTEGKIQAQTVYIGNFQWVALVFISPHNNKNNSYHI